MERAGAVYSGRTGGERGMTRRERLRSAYVRLWREDPDDKLAVAWANMKFATFNLGLATVLAAVAIIVQVIRAT